MAEIEKIINGDISIQVEGLSYSIGLIQEDVLRYKAICEVMKDEKEIN